jgi:excisionase family DNA binding protein
VIRFFPNHPEDIGRLESLGRGRTEGNFMANIVTAKEVGQYLKLSESTIYKLAATGEIPGFKIGDSWRFDMEEILKMIGESKKGTSRERAKPGGEAKWQS